MGYAVFVGSRLFVLVFITAPFGFVDRISMVSLGPRLCAGFSQKALLEALFARCGPVWLLAPLVHHCALGRCGLYLLVFLSLLDLLGYMALIIFLVAIFRVICWATPVSGAGFVVSVGAVFVFLSLRLLSVGHFLSLITFILASAW